MVIRVIGIESLNCEKWVKFSFNENVWCFENEVASISKHKLRVAMAIGEKHLFITMELKLGMHLGAGSIWYIQKILHMLYLAPFLLLL